MFLQALIEEFEPSTDGTHFNEQIFNTDPSQKDGPLLPTILPNPPGNQSPIEKDEENSPMKGNTERRRSSGILLEKIDQTYSTPRNSSSLLSEPSHNSSSSSRSGNETPGKTRFSTFISPDPRSLPSSSTTQHQFPSTPTPTPRHLQGSHLRPESNTHSRSTSKSRSSAVLRDAGVSLSKEDPEIEEDDIYPDPYGISPETGIGPSRLTSTGNAHIEGSGRGSASGSGSGNGSGSGSTRERAEESENRLAGSIIISKTRSPMPSKSRRNSPGIGVDPKYNKENGGSGLSGLGGSGLGSGLGLGRRVNERDSEGFKRYRAGRKRSLLDWWFSYIEDVGLFFYLLQSIL